MRTLIIKSNLIYFFGSILILLTFSGCSSDKDINEIIPYTKVEINLPLNYYSDLNYANTPIHITNYNGRRPGYMGHGIIVMRVGDQFKAYDATCTNDPQSPEPLEIDGITAVCPICGSTFDLFSGNYFDNSKAQYPLKEYQTFYSVSTNTLRIFN